jgi:outer membrane protein
LFAPYAYAQDAGALMQQAEALLAKGQAAEAYQLLAPLEAQQKNDPRFDYLLGASLLESNQPEKAIVPLKRALALNPLFAAARLDLGRAHFAVGNYDEAKSAFITTAYQNPPPAAQQAIDYYLTEIERRSGTTNLSGNAYVAVTVGRDSNVTGGLESSQLYLFNKNDPANPIPFSLDKNNIKTADAYLSYNVGTTVRLAMDYNFALFANADVQGRDNNTYRNPPDPAVALRDGNNLSSLNSINGAINLGLEKNFGQTNFKISGNFGRGILDYANLRRNNGGTLEWRYDFSRLAQLNFIAQAGRIRYFPIAYRDYDVNQRLFGLSWFNVSEAEGNPSLSLGLSYGEETAQGALPDGNKRSIGARLGVQRGVANSLVATAGVGFTRDQFDLERTIPYDIKPILEPSIITRRDRKFDVNLGLAWTPELNWSVRPNYTYTRATSNLSIYEFKRNDFSLSVRRDFR